MASRLSSRLRLLSPYVDEKVFRSLEKRLEGIPQPEKKPNKPQSTTENGQGSGKGRTAITSLHKKVKVKVDVDKWFQTNPAELEVKPIYKTLPNAKVALDGATPEPRFLWKEKDWPSGFPDSPEEAKTDVMTYLEQKDCYRRLQKLNAKDFSVGSVVAVTRADPLIAKGKVKFVGICIAKNHWQNTLGATFTLRNVVEGEPVEVNFQLYSPLIQRIEVLRHMRRHRKALWYLRDYPPSMSSVNEKMKALPYTEEPELYIPTKEEKKKVKAWFSGVWKAKRR
ncbi:39S ribosomal protein L19, mitochondrial-like [Acropora millepora]|uniref:39S ribosomal protein L19, mitochondrial-like n=1 Tax=Acropora millepora TaxID=45264 RepID=UPI001CF2B52C|nr:39S ribosomal protein L19, mitochondrial-like [Acropora millepora]